MSSESRVLDGKLLDVAFLYNFTYQSTAQISSLVIESQIRARDATCHTHVIVTMMVEIPQPERSTPALDWPSSSLVHLVSSPFLTNDFLSSEYSTATLFTCASTPCLLFLMRRYGRDRIATMPAFSLLLPLLFLLPRPEHPHRAELSGVRKVRRRRLLKAEPESKTRSFLSSRPSSTHGPRHNLAFRFDCTRPT